MWRMRLRDVYLQDRERWIAYSDLYGLSDRLGYSDAAKAWTENPIIQGSTNPNDYKTVSWSKEKDGDR